MVSAATALSSPCRISKRIDCLERGIEPNSPKHDNNLGFFGSYAVGSLSDNESGDEIGEKLEQPDQIAGSIFHYDETDENSQQLLGKRSIEEKSKFKELEGEARTLTVAELDQELDQAIDDLAQFISLAQKQEIADKVLNKLYDNLELLLDEGIRKKTLAYLGKVGTVEFDERTISVMLKVWMHRDGNWFFKHIMAGKLYNKHIKPDHIVFAYKIGYYFSSWLAREGIKYVLKGKTEAEIELCKRIKCVAPRNFFKGMLFTGSERLEGWKKFLDNRGLLDLNSTARDEFQNESIQHLFQLLYKEDIKDLVQDSSEFFEFVQKPETVDNVLNKLYNNIGLLANEEIRIKVIAYLQKVGAVELNKRTSAVLVKLYLHFDEEHFFKRVLRPIERNDIKKNYINLRYSGWGLTGWMSHTAIKYEGMTLNRRKPNAVKLYTRHECEAPKDFFIGVQLPKFKEYLEKYGLTYIAKKPNASCILF